MRVKKRKPKTFTVEVTGTTCEVYYEIEAEDQDTAERECRKLFKDSHGSGFDSVEADAEEDE